MKTPPNRPQRIERFGHFLLLHRIACGQSSEVWLAMDLGASQPQQLLALKRLRASHTNEQEIEAFLDEARICARLDHPGIVHIRDYGSIQGRCYICQEYVQGLPLSTLLRLCADRGLRLPMRAALLVGQRVGEALHAAHRCTGPRGDPAPVIHRDVTLSNVIVSFDGEVKLVDFGIARAEQRIGLTNPGEIKGTLTYLAPEQILGNKVSPRTDVYQLGVLMYKLLVGTSPLDTEGDLQTMEHIADGKIVKPSARLPRFPRRIEKLLLHALQKKPGKRFASARNMAEACARELNLAGGYSAQQLAALVATFAGERRALQQTFLRKLVQAHAQHPPRPSRDKPASVGPYPSPDSVIPGDMDQQLDRLFPDNTQAEPTQVCTELSDPHHHVELSESDDEGLT